MKTITVSLQSDKDAELLMGFIKSAKFEEEVETYEDQDEFTDEDIAEFDRRMAEYEKDPSRGKTIEEVKELLKRKHGSL
jgi:putative addiction module component (TIGR02574 family)